MPQNCPTTACPGCPRVFIHTEGKAQLCPVCGGSGKVYRNRWREMSTSADDYAPCHACGGKGWVTV
jgi:rRNA maturation endonuclease Nob1